MFHHLFFLFYYFSLSDTGKMRFHPFTPISHDCDKFRYCATGVYTFVVGSVCGTQVCCTTRRDSRVEPGSADS